MKTRALILAAGQGSRLRPLTNDIPKCLVPLNGKPLLDYQLESLTSAGISDLAFVTGYKAEKISTYGHQMYTNHKFESTNMVTSLFCAREFIENSEQLIVAYSDIVYHKSLITNLINHPFDISIIVDDNWLELWEKRFDDPLSDAETLIFDDFDCIQEIGLSTTHYDNIHGQYVGLIKFSKKGCHQLIDFYDKFKNYSPALFRGRSLNQLYMTDLLQLMIDAEIQINACHTHGGWFEIDSLSDLKLAENLLPFINSDGPPIKEN